jgi:hypothetical protein
MNFSRNEKFMKLLPFLTVASLNQIDSIRSSERICSLKNDRKLLCKLNRVHIKILMRWRRNM